MAGIMDSVELLELLDSTEHHVFNEVRKLILENLANNKDAWLVNALIDSFTVSHSPRCLEIIIKITEPHDKHLLDRLLDHMKGSGSVNHKLEAMLILSNVARHEPLWLHKISNHPVLVYVIKCLKTENDVCILMIGCLTLTTLLPIIPLAVSPHLSDIFDVFLRLVSFTAKKTGGMIKAHKLHLQVGIQCMFHRLYGMYPCNFLAYLRVAFCRPENMETFETIIRPLLGQIRMHPLLVTAAKDKELSKDRWREMEVHDVVVECAQLSLDPVAMELLASPVKQKPDLSDKPTDKRSRGGLTSLTTFIDPSSAWSPSRVTDLNTPPTLPSSSSGSSGAKQETSGKKELGVLDSPLRRLTALNTAGPPPSPRLFIGGDNSLPSTPRLDRSDPGLNNEQVSKTACKLSFEIPSHESHVKSLPELNLAKSSNQQLLVSHETEAAAGGCTTAPSADIAPSAAVPAAPLVPVAAGESIADGSSRTDIAAAAISSNTAITAAAGLGETSAASSNSATASGSTAETTVRAGELTDADLPDTCRATVSTQTSLNENNSSEGERGMVTAHMVSVSSGTDDDLTGYNRNQLDSSATHKPNPADLHPSAASVAAFMKKVKRIRYSSHREREGTDSHSGSSGTVHRSESMFGSCPTLTNIPEAGIHISTSSDSGNEQCDTSAATNSAGLLMKRSDRLLSRGSLVTPSLVTVGLSPVVTTVATGETQTSYYAMLRDSYKDPVPVSGCQIAREDEEERNAIIASEMEGLLGRLLPLAPFIQCYSCARKSAGRLCMSSDVEYGALALKTGSITPMYLTYSPRDILDHHIRASVAVHGKQYGKAKAEADMAASSTPGGSSSQGGIVGGVGGGIGVGEGGKTAADEASQVTLLHNLLMFSQHRQEVHARRNRRLLGRTIKVVSLEEQNTAMKDQLRLQEEELSNLRLSLRNLQQQNSELKSKVENLTKEKSSQAEATTIQISELKNHVKDLEQSLSARKSENEQLVMKLDMANNTLFSRGKELELLKVKAEGSGILREQVNQLNREILLMGELHSKYQQRLSTVSSSSCERAQLRNFMQAAKNECIELRSLLKETTVHLRAEQTKSVSIEKQLKEKVDCISELKKLLEETKIAHGEEIQSLKSRLKAERASVISEQRKTMELLSQLEIIRDKPTVRGRRCDVSTSPLSSPPYGSPETFPPPTSAAAPGGGATRGLRGESSPDSVVDVAVICDTNQGILSSD